MYGLVDANGEYDEDAVQALQEQLAEAAGQQEEQRDSTKHDMIFHWVVFVSGFIVAVAGGVSKTLDTLQWGCRRPSPWHPLASHRIPSHP